MCDVRIGKGHTRKSYADENAGTLKKMTYHIARRTDNRYGFWRGNYELESRKRGLCSAMDIEPNEKKTISDLVCAHVE
ncbi:hypothetical protein EVAR_89751_1 [Eumeta japonica]|uniref:Uncharacterized protein n=1 Tax=Eumeta variegata TaxID=151549 RepID=A0A4C1SPW5_EUMVA|nr:hypothetical protein EVAR_89751_1 [Eumeta japonica]